MNRRLFVQRAMLLGAGSILLAACGEDDDVAGDPIADPESDDDEVDEPSDDDEPVGETDDESVESDDESDEQGDVGSDDTVGRMIIIGSELEPDVLDPHVSGWGGVAAMALNLFDPLIWVNPEDLTFHPGLAEHWEANDEATEYTFELRDNVTFHDGTEFNAEAVKFSFDRIVDPATGSNFAVDLLGQYQETEVLDEFTVRVLFEEPFAAFIDGATRANLGIASPTAVEEYGDDFGRNPVGSGSFIFEEWVSDQHVRLRQNPDYNWASPFFENDGPPRVEGLEYRVVPEESTRLAAFEAGELDLTGIPHRRVAEFRDDDRYTVLTHVFHGFPSSYLLNTERSPTDDIRVRQALNHAIDREIVVQISFDGAVEAAHGPLNSPSLGFDPEISGPPGMYPYDPDRAIELLEEAGWTPGSDGIREKDGERLELRFVASPGWEAYAEPVQPQLAEIGVHMEIDIMDAAARTETNQAGGHHLAALGFSSSDPSVLTTIFHSDNIETGFGWSRWRSDELDELLLRAQGTADIEEREELYSEIQRYIMENALCVPLISGSSNWAMPEHITGLELETRGFPYFLDIRIEE